RAVPVPRGHARHPLPVGGGVHDSAPVWGAQRARAAGRAPGAAARGGRCGRGRACGEPADAVQPAWPAVRVQDAGAEPRARSGPDAPADRAPADAQPDARADRRPRRGHPGVQRPRRGADWHRREPTQPGRPVRAVLGRSGPAPRGVPVRDRCRSGGGGRIRRPARRLGLGHGKRGVAAVRDGDAVCVAAAAGAAGVNVGAAAVVCGDLGGGNGVEAEERVRIGGEERPAELDARAGVVQRLAGAQLRGGRVPRAAADARRGGAAAVLDRPPPARRRPRRRRARRPHLRGPVGLGRGRGLRAQPRLGSGHRAGRREPQGGVSPLGPRGGP
ncbi:hypothetical protein IWQ56_007350, partial [Coemansia nantahalensis]